MSVSLKEYLYNGFLALASIMLAGKWFDRLEVDHWQIALIYAVPFLIALLGRISKALEEISDDA